MLLHLSHNFCSDPAVTGQGHVPSTKVILFLADKATIIFLLQPPRPLPEKGAGTNEIPGISEECTNRGLEGSGENVSVDPMAITQYRQNDEYREQNCNKDFKKNPTYSSPKHKKRKEFTQLLRYRRRTAFK